MANSYPMTPSEAIRKSRADLSPFLVHLTRSGKLKQWRDIVGSRYDDQHGSLRLCEQPQQRSREYNLDYMLEGVRTLELAEKAPTLYKSMTVEEKRELINIVLSNPKLTDGNLDFT